MFYVNRNAPREEDDLRLLLINPRAPESFWSFRWALDTILPQKRAVNPPLGLATLAALCPDSWEVTIVDENVESVPLRPKADIVGICGMGVQFERQRELLAWFRTRGYFTVAGGSYASLCPEQYADLADAVIAGEAEYIWKEFCADFEAGAPRALYRETREVSLLDSPTPRFDLLKLDRYNMVSLQFSRGCPFRCEFCDIIVMFGRKPRVKSVDQIHRELDLLRRLGARNVFFVDDNFIGNKPLAKQLLRAIAAYQREHGYVFRFGTEASLNLAQDEELMQLFREANFQWVFIGIESPDPDSLTETGKLQNLREDILTSLQRLYRNGIDVFGGFIVGFDHDTTETFALQHDFIMRSGIQVAMVGLLTALPRTPLFERLRSEGRLLEESSSDNTRLHTNVIPKRMTLEQMQTGYQELYRRLCSHRGIADRIVAKMRHLAPARGGLSYSLVEQARIAARVFLRGIRPGGWSRWWHFLRTAALATPRQIPLVISEWVSGLSMRQYAARFVVPDPLSEQRLVERYASRLREKLEPYIQTGALEVSLEHVRHALPNLSVTLRRAADARCLRHAARQLKRILQKSRSTITLRIEKLERADAHHIERLLKRLRRHADRVSVSLAEALHEIVEVDSSRFHLVVRMR
jgi:radical SAM superfamily enzyme YgiQ (UPF0313 family)